ncbi:hypothetical protein CDAR_311691 [Caerostris darwini]|uniref:Uncharacterized protein n=1 Tax=Caerostris darwini TaxID=1538125 RepID=A0AAV4TNM5_9ARAC|nr:hypothetical protein CDAR_311691 [Caerostris darwini]
MLYIKRGKNKNPPNTATPLNFRSAGFRRSRQFGAALPSHLSILTPSLMESPVPRVGIPCNHNDGRQWMTRSSTELTDLGVGVVEKKALWSRFPSLTPRMTILQPLKENNRSVPAVLIFLPFC